MGEKLYPEVMDLKDKLLKWYECRVAIDMACGDLHENTPLLKEAAETIAALRAELDLALKAHVFVSDEWNKAKKRLEKLEKRDEVWRGKKEMLENDLAKAWEQLARYREFIKKLADVKHEPDKLLCLLEREAIKAVEGDQGSEAAK